MTGLALLVSDVDGTLVTPDKILTPASVAAAAMLGPAGIGLSLVSARPPRGMAKLVKALSISLPCAGFNGAVIYEPSGAVIEGRWLAPHTALSVLDLLQWAGVCAWVFAGDDWFLTDAEGPEVWRERRTIDFEPTLAADLRSLTAPIGKIVGVSDDKARLDACEDKAREVLGRAASVERSQSYYLDFTHPEAAKGLAVTTIAHRLGAPLADTAVIGDMYNDLSMFAVAGLQVAMGQAPAPVKAAAREVTASNSEEGFAEAIRRFILPAAKAA